MNTVKVWIFSPHCQYKDLQCFWKSEFMIGIYFNAKTNYKQMSNHNLQIREARTYSAPQVLNTVQHYILTWNLKIFSIVPKVYTFFACQSVFARKIKFTRSRTLLKSRVAKSGRYGKSTCYTVVIFLWKLAFLQPIG